jgi:hypothetical protein
MRPVDITRAQAIPGYMHERELMWLAEQAQRSRTIIEVDPWSGPYITDSGNVHKIQTAVYDEFKANLSEHIEAGRVIPIARKFTDSMRILQQQDKPDLVFIDGDHRYEEVLGDIARAMELLLPGGIVSGHDYGHSSWPGVRRAVDKAFGSKVQRVKSIWWVIA